MLYRQYRPTTWDEVVGQAHVVRTLQGALKSGHIGHAYLFAGPRGTGKTTLARILAKAINCTAKSGRPCGTCEFCTAMEHGALMDVIEIDAASNRGIEDVRSLKETAATAPSAASHKIFIIDEVHMLSRDAFNALLKLLEEPPAHVAFILATTEPHKVLPTVLSRVQRFDFHRLTQAQITAKLARVVQAERIAVDGDVLPELAGAADGAMRDAEVMLTKLVSHAAGGRISAATVQAVLGMVPHAWHARMAQCLSSGDRTEALRMLADAVHDGADVDLLARGLLELLRHVMITKIDPTITTSAGLADTRRQHIAGLAATMDGAFLVRAIQACTKARAELRASSIPSLPLELAIIELTNGGTPN